MLIVDRNYIEMRGQRIDRPGDYSPSQWLKFWEPLNNLQASIDAGMRQNAKARGVEYPEDS